MRYYDKLIFELSHPGRVGYSLPDAIVTAETDAATDEHFSAKRSCISDAAPKNLLREQTGTAGGE